MPMKQFGEDVNLTLDVTTYGNIEKVTDTISKCRVRIFYKGLNRNRTYITEDFANQLIASLPYAPIKGIFSYLDVDYEDHGENNTDGRIYGIVPENPNFAWESHLDTDGVTREYATCDVYLFTGLYPEASLVPDKPQSMEIFRDTMKGEWRIHEDGKPCFYFFSGCLIGLQILGKKVEPCFEGAAFFNLYKELQDCFNYIIGQENNLKEGEKQMDKANFRLSDNEKADLIFDAINPNFNEAGNWTINYMILDVYDDYALCYNHQEKKYCRMSYTKDNNANTVSVGDPVDVFIVDVTASEYAALETMKAIGGTYEQSNEAYTALQNEVEELKAGATEFATKEEEFNSKIAELTEQVNNLNNEKETFTKNAEDATIKISEFETQISDLTAEKVRLEAEKNDIINENTELSAFKKNVEIEKKTAIIDEFSDHLTDEQIENYKKSMDDYDVASFKKEVCTAAYESNPAIFSKESGLIYKNESTVSVETGALRILNRFINGGNK